jgi:hypothetical protein
LIFSDFAEMFPLAIGPAELVLGWTPVVQGKVRRQARAGLDEFLARERG